MSLAGMSTVSVELSSRCDKACSFCGRQNKLHNPHLVYGDMDLVLLNSLCDQIPAGVSVSFHRDGEPLVYPFLNTALEMFKDHVTSIVTNGHKLGDLAEDILRRPPTSICVSMFKGDPDAEKQLRSLVQFLDVRGGERRTPLLLVKIVGDDLDPVRMRTLTSWADVGLLRIIRRLLHAPQGDHHYRRAQPTIPEGGVCLDLLHHPSIDWQGNVYLCQRLDAEQRHFLGRIPPFTLDELWNSEPRKSWVRAHLEGRRAAVPACAKCEFWGVPSGPPA